MDAARWEYFSRNTSPSLLAPTTAPRAPWPLGPAVPGGRHSACHARTVGPGHAQAQGTRGRAAASRLPRGCAPLGQHAPAHACMARTPVPLAALAPGRTCRANSTSRANRGLMRGYMNVPAYDEAALMEALATHGPVGISFNAGLMPFKYYSAGVYSNPDCKTVRERLNAPPRRPPPCIRRCQRGTALAASCGILHAACRLPSPLHSTPP